MKTIVVTGASRGIGLATARKFLKEGWRVIGTYLRTPVPVTAEHFVAVRLDQGSAESVARAANEIAGIAPRLDALVNNAGIVLDALDAGADVRKIMKTFDVDVFGVVDFTERLLPLMAAGGHIVNVDSQYGAFSFSIDDKSSTGYRMAKAALNMYTRALAFRLKKQRIIVSSLDPGWVKTDMGNIAATETERPDREPEEPAEDIYRIVTTVKESGCFWKSGKKREW